MQRILCSALVLGLVIMARASPGNLECSRLLDGSARVMSMMIEEDASTTVKFMKADGTIVPCGGNVNSSDTFTLAGFTQPSSVIISQIRV